MIRVAVTTNIRTKGGSGAVWFPCEVEYSSMAELFDKLRLEKVILVQRLETGTDPLFDMQRAIKAHFDTMIGEVNAAMRPILDAANQYTREKKAREQREAEEQKRRLEEEQARLRAKAEQGGKSAVQAAARADALGAQAETITTTVKASDAVRTKMAGGGVATAKTSWTFEVTDYDKIDLEALRPFLNRDHVEAAIRSMVRVQKGNTKINGVRVFEDAKASFRK
jgi:hypothetical protein